MEMLQAKASAPHRPDLQRLEPWRRPPGRSAGDGSRLTEGCNPKIFRSRIEPLVHGRCTVVDENLDAALIQEHTHAIPVGVADERSGASDVHIASLDRDHDARLTIGAAAQFQPEHTIAAELRLDLRAVGRYSVGYERFLHPGSWEHLPGSAKRFELRRRPLL